MVRALDCDSKCRGFEPRRSPSFRLFSKVLVVTIWEAIILGIVQGLTEFLPVSSSGHLTLGQHFLGFQDLHQYILFDLICHLGTLLAIFLIFFSEIKKVITNDFSRFKQVVLATLPLFPLALLIKPLHSLFDQPQLLGFFFIITALLIYAGNKFTARLAASQTAKKRSWRDPLIIGLFQAGAILPGISRSGSTISAARMLGWERQDAILFSFLLAIPAILGGTALELIQLFAGSHVAVSGVPIGWEAYFFGFLTSFVVGAFALLLLMRIVAKDKLMIFAWYCLALGIATSCYFLIAT